MNLAPGLSGLIARLRRVSGMEYRLGGNPWLASGLEKRRLTRGETLGAKRGEA